MSRTHPIASSSSNFQSVFNAALEAYEKKTKRNLLADSLTAQFQTCDSPTAILSVLEGLIQQSDLCRSDQRLTNWLKPVIHVLYAFFDTLTTQGVSLIRFICYLPSPRVSDLIDRHPSGIHICKCDLFGYWHPSFGEHHPRSLSTGYYDTGIFQAATNVDASQDMLIGIFEHIKDFFTRLAPYTEVPPTDDMSGAIVEIMAGVLSVLAIATKDVDNKRSRSSELITIVHVFLSIYVL